jgi:pimeloyl-ACP methyl ester carboxylesterase
VALIAGAGHYPHVEQPQLAGGAIVGFLSTRRTSPRV